MHLCNSDLSDVVFLPLHLCPNLAGRTIAEDQERTCESQESPLEENHQGCGIQRCGIATKEARESLLHCRCFATLIVKVECLLATCGCDEGYDWYHDPVSRHGYVAKSGFDGSGLARFGRRHTAFAAFFECFRTPMAMSQRVNFVEHLLWLDWNCQQAWVCGVGTDGNDTIEYTEFLAAALDKSKILKEECEGREFIQLDTLRCLLFCFGIFALVYLRGICLRTLSFQQIAVCYDGKVGIYTWVNLVRRRMSCFGSLWGWTHGSRRLGGIWVVAWDWQDIVWQAFRIFDSDGNGTVTRTEFCKLLTSGRTDKTKCDKEARTIEVFFWTAMTL